MVWKAGIVVAVLGAIAVGAIAPHVWQSWGRIKRIQAGLPALPRLEDRPAGLREALESAARDVGKPGTVLAGVAHLGRLYHANGFVSEAEACWRLLQQEDPREARWYYFQADLRRLFSDHAALEVLLRHTVERAPDYAPAWLQLAELAFKSARFEEAEKHYRTRLRLLPGDPYASLGVARIALQRGERDQARTLLEGIIEASPAFSPAHNLYAEMVAASGDVAAAHWHRWQGREAGRLREAPDPWLDALIDDCFDPRRLRVLGTIAFQVNEPGRAEELFRRAVALAPADSSGHELLGELLLARGQPGLARDAFEQARTCEDPERTSIMLYVNLGAVHRQLGDYDRARRTIVDALARRPEAFELHSALGVTFSDQGRHEEAEAAFRAALARNPGDAETNFNLGLSLLELKRRDEARAAFEQALTMQPSFPKALFMLGRLQMEQGNLSGAVRFLLPLYESHPEQVPVRKLLAQWHLGSGRQADAQGDFIRAERHYRAGLEIDDETAALYINLGALCLQLNRPAEAVRSLDAYRRLQPGDPQGALLLGQSYLRLGRRSEARSVLEDAFHLAMRAGQDDVAGQCRDLLIGVGSSP